MDRFVFSLDPYFASVQDSIPRMLLSIVIAMMSTYSAIELAGRVAHAADRLSARLWIVAGAAALGTGIWSMHFVGMSAANYPFDAFYEVGATAGSWLLAVTVSGVLLSAALHEGLTTPKLWGYAVACGVGLSAMHYVGTRAMAITPDAGYYPLWVVASIACAIGGCALALSQIFRLQHREGWSQIRGQCMAAMLFGASLAGMHYLAMAAIDFADGTICTSRDGLDARVLGGGVAVASIGFLLLRLLITILERRAERLAGELNASLVKAQSDLRWITLHDALTGLPTRLVFQDRLVQAVDQGPLAVLLVEIDDLQAILHARGDSGRQALMREIALRLTSATDHLHTVADVGNHQFLLLVTALVDVQQAIRITGQIGAAFVQPCTLGSSTVRLSTSVGVTLHPTDGDATQIVRRASVALETVRKNGGNGYAFFESRMDVEAHETSALLEDLRMAIGRGELELHYQPKVHAQSGKIAGAEALLRWRHPVRGMVGPVVFIPIAERFGLIDELGGWVIEEACRQMRAWSDIGIRMRVAINVSVIQLRRPDLAGEITRALARRDVAPQLLTCEITESGAMQDTEATLAIFHRLQAAGVQISIDDFGTGYSSLSYLRKMPVRQLKIDRSFVKDLEGCPDAEVMVAAIIQMAHALRLEVVAEGVETVGQRDVLLRLGCDKFQGWLYAKPMAADAFTDMAIADTSLRQSFRNSLFAASPEVPAIEISAARAMLQ